jgi:hypothetical protein
MQHVLQTRCCGRISVLLSPPPPPLSLLACALQHQRALTDLPSYATKPMKDALKGGSVDSQCRFLCFLSFLFFCFCVPPPSSLGNTLWLCLAVFR